MLLSEFDKDINAVINPEALVKRSQDFPKTCVAYFSKKIIEEIVEVYHPQEIEKLANAVKVFPIYRINVKGEDIAVMQAPVGAPASVMIMEELGALGAKNFIFIGSCGCLIEAMENYSIILPTSAIRDEGTSYHYLPAEDEIELDKECVDALEEVIKSFKIKPAKGKTWTTDAFYRETKGKVEDRKSRGAITVEMECSALTAVAKFRGFKFAQILYGADNLGGEEYDARSLIDNDDLSSASRIIPIGLACACEFNRKFK